MAVFFTVVGVATFVLGWTEQNIVVVGLGVACFFLWTCFNPEDI